MIPNRQLTILKKPDGTPWVLGQGSYGQVRLPFRCWDCASCVGPRVWVWEGRWLVLARRTFRVLRTVVGT